MSVVLVWHKGDFKNKRGRNGELPNVLKNILRDLKKKCVECSKHEKVFESQSTIEGNQARYDVVFQNEQQAKRFNTNVANYKTLPEKVYVRSFLYSEVEFAYNQAPVLTEMDILQIVKTDQVENLFKHFLTCSVGDENDTIVFKFNTLADVNLFLYNKCGSPNRRVLGMFRNNQEQLCLLADSDGTFSLRVKHDPNNEGVYCKSWCWEQLEKKFGFNYEHLGDYVNLKFKAKLDLYTFYASVEAKTCQSVEITQEQLGNPQEQLEKEEKALKDKILDVERELVQARVELAKKEEIYRSQRRLIAELRTEYNVKLKKRNA